MIKTSPALAGFRLLATPSIVSVAPLSRNTTEKLRGRGRVTGGTWFLANVSLNVKLSMLKYKAHFESLAAPCVSAPMGIAVHGMPPVHLLKIGSKTGSMSEKAATEGHLSGERFSFW